MREKIAEGYSIDGVSVEEQHEVTCTEGLRGGETIIIVEDQDAVRRLTTAILKVHGYHILEAANGDEALDIAQKHSGEIHLFSQTWCFPESMGRN